MPHTGLRKLLAAGLLSASLWLPQGGFTAPSTCLSGGLSSQGRQSRTISQKRWMLSSILRPAPLPPRFQCRTAGLSRVRISVARW